MDMATIEKFEDLRVWQQARDLNRTTYQVTVGLKDYSFIDQIRRAALSVMNNIAEGFERRTDNDFAHFIDMAKGSAREVRSMTYAAEDLGYVTLPALRNLRERASALGAGLGAFANYLRKKSK